MDALFPALLTATGVVASAIAAVAGFGIGSLLTPLLALRTGTQLAVAAVAIPHAVGSAQRFWRLRAHVDRRVLVGFGVTSALFGLVGALLHARASSRALDLVFGGLLVLAGVSELTGWVRRVRWGRAAAWVAGALSGAFGGLVGNQGGIRSAAMLGFDVPPESFVATATAVALFVDAARLPVYLATQGREIAALWPLLALATGGVLVGTVLGVRVLARLPQPAFRRLVAVLLLALGLSVIVRGEPRGGAQAGAARAAAGPAAGSAYRPRTRAITVTTVPLLVRESQKVFPFLASDFAKGGVLEGREVYAFVPSTIVAADGDTLAFTFVNPEDDLHTFVLPDLVVALPGQKIVRATYVARHAGIFPITCNIPAHLPMMSGQLVVLAPSALAGDSLASP